MASSEPGKQARQTPPVKAAQSPPVRGVVPIQPPRAAATPPAPNPSGGGAETGPAEVDEVSALVIENAPPWLFSMAFHMLMMIVMGLIVYVNIPSKPIHLEAEALVTDKVGDQLELDAGDTDVKTTAEHVLLTPDNLPFSDSPLAAPGEMQQVFPEGLTATSEVQAAQIGMALSGREEGSAKKTGLLGPYGERGKVTEGAVGKGLAWLAKQQHRDGSWSLAGPYSDGVPFKEIDNRTAATAMALLALQGAGSTHMGGRYKTNVTNAWRWLLKEQDDSGCFFKFGPNSHRFYTHAQCSIAVCELYGMTKDTKYQEPARRAIDYCVKTQSPQGGWRYNPNVDSDVSVTGWVVMALQSARMAGLEVPKETLYNVERFLDAAAQNEGSRYPYQINGDVRLSMTAEALLMRQYLGWKHDDKRLAAGVEWITAPDNLVNFDRGRDVYFWYYATQVAHHMGGEPWKRWNYVMSRALPEHQVPRGKEAGSWDPNRPTPDQWGSNGGRLYVTCLSICMLEVYYRHLPIYSHVFSR